MPTLSTITYEGFTINFTSPVEIGYWYNGTPFVYDAPGTNSVSIASVSPNPTDYPTAAGAMINPLPEGGHGFGSRYLAPTAYNSGLNANLSFPIILSEGDVYVTSRPSDPSSDGFDMKAQFPLHILGSATAPVDAIAPSPFGDASYRSGPIITWSDLNSSLLPDKSKVGKTDLPTPEYMASRTNQWQFLEWNRQYNGYYITGIDNMNCASYPGHVTTYGQDYSNRTSQALCWLCYDFTDAEKKPVIMSMVQHGMDLFAYNVIGGIIWPDGGHKVGRMAPMYLAAVLLESATLKAQLLAPMGPGFPTSTYWIPEFDCTFVIGPEHVEDPSQPVEAQFITADIGLPEWRIKGSTQPQHADFRWPSYGAIGPYQSFEGNRIPDSGGTNYRFGNWGSLLGTWAAIILIDPGACGHIPFLLYGYRHYVVFGSPNTNWIENLIVDHVLPLGGLSPNPASFTVAGLLVTSGVMLEPGTEIAAASTSGGADLYYIFIPDGDPDADPTDADDEWTGDFEATESGTLKVIAIEAGLVVEPITSLTFVVIDDGTAVPSINQTATCS